MTPHTIGNYEVMSPEGPFPCAECRAPILDASCAFDIWEPGVRRPSNMVACGFCSHACAVHYCASRDLDL